MVSSSVDTSGDGWFNAKYKGWQAEAARLHPREMQYARDATRWSQEMAAQYAGDAAKVDWPEWQAEAEQQYREGCARRDAAGEEKRLQEEAEQEQLFLEWADKEQRADQAQADKKQRADKAQQWAEFVIWQKNDRENAHNDALEFERMTKSQMTISQWENLSRKQQKNHTRDHQRAAKLNKTVPEYKQGIKEALHKEQATPYRQNQHEEERHGIVHIDFKKGQMADPQSNKSKANRKYWECQAARHPFSLRVVAWSRKDGKNRGGASASRCSDSPKDKSPFGTSMEDKDSARFKLLELTMQRINAQAMDVDGVKMREKLACKDAAWHERNESIEEAIHRLRSEEDIREDREWKWSQMPHTIMHDNSWTQYTHDEWLSHLRTKVDRAIEECRPEYYTMPHENKKDFWDLITDALVQEEHVKHIELLDESCRHLLDAGENGNSFKKQRTETDIRDAEHAEARRQQEVCRRAQEKDEAAEERARQRGCARKISLIMKMPSPRPKMIQVKIEGDTAEMLRDTTEIVLDTSGPEDEEEEAEAEEEEVEVEEKGSGKESKWIEDDDWGKRKRKQVVFSARCKYKAQRKDSNTRYQNSNEGFMRPPGFAADSINKYGNDDDSRKAPPPPPPPRPRSLLPPPPPPPAPSSKSKSKSEQEQEQDRLADLAAYGDYFGQQPMKRRCPSHDHLVDGGQDLEKAVRTSRRAYQHFAGYTTSSMESRLEFTEEFLAADVIVASTGLHTMERGAYSAQEDFRVEESFYDWQEVRGYVYRKGKMKRPKDEALNDKVLLAKFDKSFRANYPTLTGSRKITYVDCTGLKDPGRDRTLHGHRGSHERILNGVAKAHGVDKVMKQAVEGLGTCKDGHQRLVVAVCKSGRHRSVAVKEKTVHAYRSILYRGEDLIGSIDLQNQSDWSNLCCRNGRHCGDCDYDRRYNAENLPWAYAAWTEKMEQCCIEMHGTIDDAIQPWH